MNHLIDPYYRLGLKCNPFCVQPGMQEIPKNLWLDRGFSQAPPLKSNLFLQIIGDPGAGKSSHLHHWRQQTGGDYTYYPPEVLQRWQWPNIGPIAYWDEVDRMPLPLLFAGLMLAKQQNSTIVAGTHECLKWAAKRFGFRVQTIRLPAPTHQELREWSTQRINAVRLPNTEAPELSLTDEEVQMILESSHTSWRQAATLLHIWVAQQSNSTIQKAS